MRSLQVTFVRTRGARDRVYIRRADGSEASWEFPSYGDALPHDLVHLVVESRLAFTGGVWGHVAAGADLGRINAAADRKGGKDKYRELGDDRDEVVVAEVLANAPWLRSDEAPRADDVHAALVGELAALGRAPLATLTVETIAALRAELGDWLAKWRALGERGALVLEYPLT